MRAMLTTARLIAHVLVAMFKLSVTARLWTPARRRTEIAAWSRDVFALLNVRLVVRGTPVQSHAALFAGNHVSWLDICALLAAAELRFVAKSEVREWPMIGWLATQLGTHFIVRNRRCEAYAATLAMTGLLGAGEKVCIFPEGSTTDGASLQPFRAALFEPASEGRTALQPFAIRYVDGQGRRTEAAAFVGDMSIADSLAALMQHREVICEIVFLPLIDTVGKCRRTLARETELAIMTTLGIAVSHSPPPLVEQGHEAPGDFALA